MMMTHVNQSGRRSEIERLLADAMKVDRERLHVYFHWPDVRSRDRHLQIALQGMTDDELEHLRKEVAARLPPTLAWLLTNAD